MSAVDYKQLITNAAGQYGVPPEIALAVAQQESGIQQYGSDGKVLARYEAHLDDSSLGIFQLLGSTARDLKVDPNDPVQNIQGGVRYLKQMYAMTGSWPDALAAYNGGIGNWQRGTTTTDAWKYSQQVMARAGLTQTPAGGGSSGGGGGAPDVTTKVGLPDTDFGGWLASVFGSGDADGGQPVYGSDLVYTAEGVGDAGPNVALLLVLGLAAALVISQV